MDDRPALVSSVATVHPAPGNHQGRTIMWAEIGKTVRKAMHNWGNVARMCVCVTILTFATMAIIWTGTM
ncbi:hypothetical protein [Nocardia sp. NPDC051463]|uniref:hypothetical protein n=1 Tax=Nocardia sp. NPDC051463 TaxID=3154845 RepID=UPI0034401845